MIKNAIFKISTLIKLALTVLLLSANSAFAFTHSCYLTSSYGSLSPNMIYDVHITFADRLVYNYGYRYVVGRVTAPYNDTSVSEDDWTAISNLPALRKSYFASGIAIKVDVYGDGQLSEHNYGIGASVLDGDVCPEPPASPVWLYP